eukprot:COSAG04_NODE_20863_length_384_cov_1.624561_1_plen_74_part_01
MAHKRETTTSQTSRAARERQLQVYTGMEHVNGVDDWRRSGAARGAPLVGVESAVRPAFSGCQCTPDPAALSARH